MNSKQETYDKEFVNSFCWLLDFFYDWLFKLWVMTPQGVAKGFQGGHARLLSLLKNTHLSDHCFVFRCLFQMANWAYVGNVRLYSNALQGSGTKLRNAINCSMIMRNRYVIIITRYKLVSNNELFRMEKCFWDFEVTPIE